jgi:hypothetical protein
MSDNQEQEFPEVTAVQARYDKAYQGLYHHNDPDGGKPKYDREVHQAKVEALQAVLEKEMGAIVRSADETIKAAQAEIDNLSLARDPLTVVDSETLTRANLLGTFVKGDVQDLSLGVLVEKAKVALADGDRASQALLAKYLPARIKQERANGRPTVEVQVSIRDLEGLLKQLQQGFLDPQLATQHEAAQGRLEQARRLRQVADMARPNKDREILTRFGL